MKQSYGKILDKNCLKTKAGALLQLLLRVNFDRNFDEIKLNWFSWDFSRKYSKLTLDLIFRLPKILKSTYKLSFDIFQKIYVCLL